jgi:hypothetical protein
LPEQRCWWTKPLIFLGCAVIFAIVANRISPHGPHPQVAKVKANLALAQLPPSVKTEQKSLDIANQYAAESIKNPSLKFDTFLQHETTKLVQQHKAQFQAVDPSLKPDTLEDDDKNNRPERLRRRLEAGERIYTDQPGKPVFGPEESHSPQKGSIWPVFLAGAAFLYLWWLAALFFDLVVVWHHYIRSSAILDRLEEIRHPASRLGGNG